MITYGTEPMPVRIQVWTLLMMWTAVTISVVYMYGQPNIPRWVVPIPVLAVIVGSWFVIQRGELGITMRTRRNCLNSRI